jgi:hypothetical protein
MPDWTGRTVANRDDVARAIAELTRHDRSGTSALARAVQTGDQAQLTADASKLLPRGPRAQGGHALAWRPAQRSHRRRARSASLVPTLLAGGMAEGAWVAVVGQP